MCENKTCETNVTEEPMETMFDTIEGEGGRAVSIETSSEFLDAGSADLFENEDAAIADQLLDGDNSEDFDKSIFNDNDLTESDGTAVNLEADGFESL